MTNKVAIIGMGIISAIGDNVADNYDALMNNKPGIRPLELIDSIHKGKLLTGEIKHSNEELQKMLGVSDEDAFTRTGLLSALAAKQALEDAQLTDINAYKAGFINASSVGGMDMTERFFLNYAEENNAQKYIQSHDLGAMSNKVATYLGLKGMVTTISTACSSAANAIMLGTRLILSGKLDTVIVGGVDALSKFTINGFNTLMILSDELNKPFDNQRNGLNLGEGAAYMVLASDKVVNESHKKPLAYLVGWGNANDAYHQTASSEAGDGAILAMKSALDINNIAPEWIDYINVHGTATPNNDLSEGNAINKVFHSKLPLFSSTKPFTGHTLGAAAGVEAIFSILAIQHQVVFPNLNFSTPISGLSLTPTTQLTPHKIQYVLSNSFGFGGNCSSLIFSKS